jgi:hypothetical protein
VTLLEMIIPNLRSVTGEVCYWISVQRGLNKNGYAFAYPFGFMFVFCCDLNIRLELLRFSCLGSFWWWHLALHLQHLR